MQPQINETHDPHRRTWVPMTRAHAADFPIQNLPFGRFQPADSEVPGVGIAIGDAVLDLGAAVSKGLLKGDSAEAVRSCGDGWLNPLMALTPERLGSLRLDVSRLLSQENSQRESVRTCLHPSDKVAMRKPVDIRNYTDFFTSIHHARNTGRLKRPDSPLQPNFHALPIAYHGRASTIEVGGIDFQRPWGQFIPDGATSPVFAPSEAIDFECEFGIYIGQGNKRGDVIRLAEADRHIFGFSLLNDWSARDVQRWEALPLGPFLAKSFLTSVSPWIVSLEAMAPFRIAAAEREADAPALLPHLHAPDDRAYGGLSVEFEVRLRTALMKQANVDAVVISRPRFADQYWTPFQMVTHHTSNGCRLEPGDLLGSGTVSGPRSDELGCLLEMTAGGRNGIGLPNGETRVYLQTGDEIELTARAVRQGFASIGFGSCVGAVLKPSRLTA